MIRLRERDAQLLSEWLADMRAAAQQQLGDNARVAVPDYIEDVRASISDQLNHPNQDSQLIDELHSILRNNNIGNILSGDTLHLLRSAIFKPSDLVRFKIESRRTIGCITCGAKLRDGSLAVYNGSSRGVQCFDCASPNYLTCHCGTRHKLPNGAIMRIVSKLFKECPICLARNNGETKQTPEDEELGVVNPFDDGPTPMQTVGRNPIPDRNQRVPGVPRDGFRIPGGPVLRTLRDVERAQRDGFAVPRLWADTIRRAEEDNRRFEARLDPPHRWAIAERTGTGLTAETLRTAADVVNRRAVPTPPAFTADGGQLGGMVQPTPFQDAQPTTNVTVEFTPMNTATDGGE